MPLSVSSSLPPSTVEVPRQTRTRRKLWLAAHPSYYDDPRHPLALPLAYDGLVRRFQSAEERAAEGRSGGWARMLEGALLRGESKREAALRERSQQQHHNNDSTSTTAAAPLPSTQPAGNASFTSPGNTKKSNGLRPLPEEEEGEKDHHRHQAGPTDADDDDAMTDRRWDFPYGIMPADELLAGSSSNSDDNEDEATGENDESARPAPEHKVGPPGDRIGRREALARWRELLRVRFIAGADDEVDYDEIDSAEGHDQDWIEAQRQEEWFMDEAESHGGDNSNGDDERRPSEGQTGIQDF